MTLGDRIVIMKDGVIQQIGTPQEVFNHPANLFVAGFIGMPQMNFYDAELVLEDGQYAVVLDGAKVTLPEEKQAKLKANGAAAGPITLGVRPEHLILSGDESSMIHGTGRQRDDGQRRPSPRQRLRQRYHYDRSHHGAGKHLRVYHRQPHRLYLQRRYGPSFRPEYPEKSGMA